MIAAAGGLAVFFMFSFGNADGREEVRLAALAYATHMMEEIVVPGEHFADAAEFSEPRIMPYTQIIYEYFDSETSGFHKAAEAAATILLGMTEDEVDAFFADWQIVSFSADAVHLRQNTNLHERQYIIGVHNGYIAVFYDNGNESVKELTARPVSALAEEEQLRLIEGIKVQGNEALMRALEDFSS